MAFSFTSAIYAILLAFVINLILCPLVIPFLTRLKFGQQVRSDGPQGHLRKAGTPTMGGIMIVASFAIACCFFLGENREGTAVLLATIAFGFIGFLDDYIKVVKKRSLGLRAYQKIIAQLVVTALFTWYLVTLAPTAGIPRTAIFIPFTAGLFLDLGWLFVPFVFFVMIGTVNAVNLTDGLDGLASGVMILVCTFFLFMAFSSGSGILPILGTAIGSLLAFLLFNTHPAKVFMGDTGSLALGGLIASVALSLGMPLFLAIAGIIFILEALSDIIQVSYFKMSGGKRVFKMAPLHHHFELSGMKETQVVAMFYIITAVACLVGFLGAQSIF